jgi:hypothetical protein
MMGRSQTQAFALPLGEGWVLSQPDTDQLIVLNATGKIVWDLLYAGLEKDEIASAFALHFGLSFEQASADVSAVISGVDHMWPSTVDSPFPLEAAPRPSAIFPSSAEPPLDPKVDCGVFRFDVRLVRVFSTVPELGLDYFSRFQHRTAGEPADADVLELSGGSSGYRLTFGQKIVATVNTLRELIGRANGLFLTWEHPDVDFLAYFHAAAVSQSGRAILLPGISGTGKSTLVGYLASRGFAYLGDDLIAMAASDWSLRPLPTCLSVKSGSWPILEAFYPQLSHCQIVQYHGRVVRYVEPTKTAHLAGAPSLILFPNYAKDQVAKLRPLTRLQTMTRLLETATDFDKPATTAKVTEFLRFVETTPAYEFTYSDLPSALNAIREVA